MQPDPDRVRLKLEDISASLNRLRRFRDMDREAFLADEDSQDIARSRLLTAMEAALNLCYHLAAKGLDRVPEEYAQCFTILADASLIDSSLAERLARMARFRNRLVHLYWAVDYSEVYDIILHDLEDLSSFSEAVAQHV